MNIFNSLGSNYNFSYILKSLSSHTSKGDIESLEKLLSTRYSGRTILFYKGREALTAAVKILDLDHNAQIAINGFTCVAVFNAIRKAGLEPICLDLSASGGLNFTAKALEDRIKKNAPIKAVVVQNTLGYPCDIKEIEQVCKKNKLVLIEDLAHCVGTFYEDGREAGTVGDIVILSFSQDKIIDAVSGGALVIRNKIFHEIPLDLKAPENSSKDRLYPLFTYKIRNLYPLRLGKPYHLLLKKLNLMSKLMNESFYNLYHLPAWNAHMALAEFDGVKAQLQHRRMIAKIYNKSLPENILLFEKNKMDTAIELSSNLRFPIFVVNRNKLVALLKKKGVFLSDIWYSDVEPKCPQAVEKSKTILNLPTHINVTEKDAENISRLINQWLS